MMMMVMTMLTMSLMLVIQVCDLEQQLSASTGQSSSPSAQHTNLPLSLSDLSHDLLTLPRPLTSMSGVDGLSDLSSESEHSSPETTTPGSDFVASVTAQM